MERLLIFLCTAASKSNEKLSSKIAARLEELEIGQVGSIRDLAAQHTLPLEQQRNMIFINDCRSACVQMLMQGLDGRKYLFFDLTAFNGAEHFNVEEYIESKIMPVVNKQWALEV